MLEKRAAAAQMNDFRVRRVQCLPESPIEVKISSTRALLNDRMCVGSSTIGRLCLSPLNATTNGHYNPSRSDVVVLDELQRIQVMLDHLAQDRGFVIL